jgi:hypothetical protein
MENTRQEALVLSRAQSPKPQRSLTASALQSLRAYRLERYANRRLVAQRKTA